MTTDSVRNDKQAIDLVAIQERLRGSESKVPSPEPNVRQAAVAIVAKQVGQSLDLMFIKRATSPGDPWSGQMAFPGGHRDPTDSSLVSAVIRETMEETGVELSQDQMLGQLPYQQPAGRSHGRRLIVVPFVFGIRFEPTVHINHEVDEVVWAGLGQLMDGSIYGVEDLSFGGSTSQFGGYRLGEGKFVWGLTFRTLQTFFELLDPCYEELSERRS